MINAITMLAKQKRNEIEQPQEESADPSPEAVSAPTSAASTAGQPPAKVPVYISVKP